MNLPITIGEWTISALSEEHFLSAFRVKSRHGSIKVLSDGTISECPPAKTFEEWEKSDAKKFLQTHHALTNKDNYFEALPFQDQFTQILSEKLLNEK